MITDQLKPNGFIFVKQEENPDYSLCRVGVNAGQISKDILDKSTQSHYFIKLKQNSDLFIIKYQGIHWDYHNITEPISKNKFIREINRINNYTGKAST